MYIRCIDDIENVKKRFVGWKHPPLHMDREDLAEFWPFSMKKIDNLKTNFYVLLLRRLSIWTIEKLSEFNDKPSNSPNLPKPREILATKVLVTPPPFIQTGGSYQ